MICETCINLEHCFERRGQCTDYERRKTLKEIRQQIESINQRYKSAGRSGADEVKVQEASRVLRPQTHSGGRTSWQLSEATAGSSEAEEKASEKEGKARSEAAAEGSAKDMDVG